MDNVARPDAWFRSAEARSYLLMLAGIVVVKIALLLVLYFAVIAPQPHVDRSPEALRRHLLSPDAAPTEDFARGR